MKTIGGKIIFIMLFIPLMSGRGMNCVAQGSFAGSHLSKFIGISEGLPSNFVDDIMFDDAGFMCVPPATDSSWERLCMSANGKEMSSN